ncbi:MAG: cupin domain-containing protein [Chloroflexi bacterium]|nr:cupin domain-containing protein [Chloroflexota bacterium]
MAQSLKLNFGEAKVPAHPQWFEGEVLQQALVPADSGRELEVLAVWFVNHGRTRPHIHSVDQLLVVVEGLCIVATQTERKVIGVGEQALIPKGEWHWHGAATGETLCHLSIKRPGPTDWDQPLLNFNE